MPDLSIGQYQLVYNMLSLTVAAMFASFVFFVFARQLVGEKYRGALVMSAIVVFVAGYHYWRIFENWDAAYELANGVYVATGTYFNDAYRYVDWLITVPLLLAELIAVLNLPKGKRGGLITKLVIASILMIATGYPGEVAESTSARLIWGFISTIPFVYILYVLWVELGKSLVRQPEEVRILVRNIRLLLLGTWGFYPITYLLPVLGLAGGSAIISIQTGYAIADILAKCGYGLMIFWIAKAKTEADEAAVTAPETTKGKTVAAPFASY